MTECLIAKNKKICFICKCLVQSLLTATSEIFLLDSQFSNTVLSRQVNRALYLSFPGNFTHSYILSGIFVENLVMCITWLIQWVWWEIQIYQKALYGYR